MLVFLGIGTNLGNKEDNIKKTLLLIEKRIGKIISCSAFYKTIPWGFSSTNSFLNAVIKMEISKTPEDLLLQTQLIEKEMGRIGKSQNGKYEDRLIDIDILFYGDQIISSDNLKIPHPLLSKRMFVLEPMDEIAPEWIDPQSHQTIHQMRINLESL